MGEIFFVIRSIVYTLILVIILQVKIGSTTLEQKVIQFTHHSQVASSIQKIAEGATQFIGNQYKSLTGHMNSKYIQKHSRDQIPGERLKAKVDELKDTVRSHWQDIEGVQNAPTIGEEDAEYMGPEGH